jgi:peptide/nickel transport system substrate-binding protein
VTGPRGPARFLTTVLFTDIVGSTEHAAELGDRAFHELIQLHNGILRASLKRHGGRELDTAGDGFFAVFDAPAAAVDCALEIAAAVRQELGIEIRAGLHVGEVQQSGSKVSGIAVVIGSRIMSAGGPSDVLVSGTVRDLTAGSGLTFEERGSRELKGVPGTWPIYAVARAEDVARQREADADRASRRAAAVRRAHARPIWERRPRLVAAISVVLALVVGLGGLLVWSPWRPPALAAVAENSIGVIDVDRAEVIGAVRVGSRPGGIAVGEGSAWVTNTGADTVSQIDLGTHAVVNTIEVERGPVGIAVADGSIWVANSGDRTVSRVNVGVGRVVDSITVGNGPTAIAVGAGAVWVANTSDSTIVRLDPVSGEVGAPIGVAAGPIALAVDDSGVWVASQDGGAVTHIDPASGTTIATPILLSSRPAALAIGAGSVWVAGSDGTVTGIDKDSGRVTATLDIGGSLSSIVVTDRSIYVADLQGTVHEVDAANPGSPARRVTIENAAQALAVVQGQVWVATRASAASHRGGTLRIVSEFAPVLDPVIGIPLYHFASFQADGLVAYRRVGGVPGSTLLPDLATSIPKPTNAGKTYRFQLRPGLVYVDGSDVRPEDFRRGIERGFQIPDPLAGATVGPAYFSAILGADACSPGPVDRCDLSDGIVTDDISRTVTFNLSEPDPDFLYKLALIHAYPAPSSVPMDAPVDGAFPGTGPYTVASVSETEIRLVRNPIFQTWDGEVRPDGFPDEIIWTSGIATDEQVAMVERGEADYTPLRFAIRNITPDRLADLRRQYPAQLHAASVSLVFAFMNAALPPFDRLEARQAVSMAIDRGHVAEIFGGASAVAITCQVLPPGYPGYRPYCPYTTEPDPGGRWRAPDLEASRRLVDASGTRGAPVMVGPVLRRHTDVARHLVAVLRALGYNATLDPTTDDAEVFRAVFEEGRVQIGVFEWFGDSLAPSGFISAFTCEGSAGLTNYCDRALDGRMNEAAELQTTDAAAAAEAWAEIDREVTDLALWAPLVNQGTDFMSARVGNYQFHPAYLVLLDQLWVQ